MWKVTVDKEKCTGDGECADVCPVDVYQLVEGRAEPVNEDDCLGCESCIEACDFDAITVEEIQLHYIDVRCEMCDMGQGL